MIYFDNAAKTKPLTCAVQAYMDALNLANPSSEHAAGVAAKKMLEDARAKIALFVGCKPNELYFTSTATEAITTVLNNAYASGVSVLARDMEHHAVLNSGFVDAKIRSCDAVGRAWWDSRLVAIAQWIDGPLLVSMLGNNETGAVETDLPRRNRDAQSINAGHEWSWLCDATASMGHIPINFHELDADYLVADALKFGGVPGAAFFISHEQNGNVFPLIRGGGQERGVRAGTENVPAIVAMAAALEWQVGNMEKNESHCRALCNEMLRCLGAINGWKQNKGNGDSLPHILNISFDGVDGKTLAMMLSRRGVMVSAGAACSSGDNEPSHVIMAMYGDEKRARSAIRISFSHENTFAEVNQAAKEIADIVRYLRTVG